MLSRLLASISLPVALPVAAATPRPVVVELLTSEGCSSCPPADAYLSELSQQRSDILPLAFHVTYWNSLGWQDPFSLDIATQRQAEYGRRFGDGSYTPDWSRYNPGVLAYIQGFGRFGIPLDVVYGPHVPQGQLLPEVLQTSTLFHALDNAKSPQTAKSNSSPG